MTAPAAAECLAAAALAEAFVPLLARSMRPIVDRLRSDSVSFDRRLSLAATFSVTFAYTVELCRSLAIAAPRAILSSLRLRDGVVTASAVDPPTLFLHLN